MPPCVILLYFRIIQFFSLEPFSVCLAVPEVEGEAESISSLCSQITNAFSTPSEDPFSSAPMTKPVTVIAPQSPAFQGWCPLDPFSCSLWNVCLRHKLADSRLAS